MIIVKIEEYFKNSGSDKNSANLPHVVARRGFARLAFRVNRDDAGTVLPIADKTILIKDNLAEVLHEMTTGTPN